MAFNKRFDAERIRNLDGFHSVVPYIMGNRADSEVSLTVHFDVTDLFAYLKKRNEADSSVHLKMFHAICMACAKTIYHRPLMNSFIKGRHFWQRKDITLSFVAKRAFSDTAEESLMFMKVTPDMTLDSVSKLILGEVKTVRESEKNNDLDATMRLLGKLPRFVMEILFGAIRFLEYHAIMPASLAKGDPNFSTMLLSNLGSIGCDAPYHHLMNYGTCSAISTIGTVKKKWITREDGSSALRDILTMNFTLDERIADGFYFVKSLRLTKYMLEHPEILEQSIETPLPEEAMSYKLD